MDAVVRTVYGLFRNSSNYAKKLFREFIIKRFFVVVFLTKFKFPFIW